MFKRMGFTVILVLGLLVLSAGTVLADLSFEQGLADWTIEQRVDEWSTTTHQHTTQVVTNRYSHGVESARLGARVVGDQSFWGYDDWTETMTWKNGTYDLRNATNIWVDMTDIQRQTSTYGWGYGMQMDLVVSDGVHESRYLLWDRHEEPYGPSGVEDNLYYQIVTGADGTQWFRYRAPLNDATKWGGGQFDGYPGGPLVNVNLASARIGISANVRSWHSSPQDLWCNALVDNLRIDYPPNVILASPNGGEILHGTAEVRFQVSHPLGKQVNLEIYLNDTYVAFSGGNAVIPPANGSPLEVVRTFNTNLYANAKDIYRIKVVARVTENPALSSQAISRSAFSIDNTPPFISIPAGELAPVLEQTSPAGAPFTFHPAITDNLDPAPVLTINPSLSVYPKDITTVTFTARDWAGNQAVVNVNVTVRDTTPPSITAPQDITVSTNPGVAYATSVNLGTPTVADNSGNANVTNNAHPEYPLGMTTVIWTATDSSGNTASATQKITVADNEPPKITIPASEQVPVLEATGPDGAPFTFHPAVTDNAGPALFITVTPSLTTYPMGVTRVTFSAADSSGNTASVNVDVTVRDTIPPVITGTITTSPNANGWFKNDVTVHFSAIDSGSGIESITPDVIITTEGSNMNATGTATDKAGNAASITLSGINIDKTPPVINVTSPQSRNYLTSESMIINFSMIDIQSGIAGGTATLDGNLVSNSQNINLAGLAGNHVFNMSATDKADNVQNTSLTFSVVMAAAADINPDVLNLKSKGGENSVTVYIELPSGYDVAQIKVSSVTMNVNGSVVTAQTAPTSVGDYDGDNVPDRMVKFDRQAVINALAQKTGDVAIVVTGQLNNGCNFIGTDKIKVNNPDK
jgi:hypothetical protein